MDTHTLWKVESGLLHIQSEIWPHWLLPLHYQIRKAFCANSTADKDFKLACFNYIYNKCICIHKIINQNDGFLNKPCVKPLKKKERKKLIPCQTNKNTEFTVYARVLSRSSRVQLFVILGTVVCQAPLATGFSQQEHWSGLPCPPPGDLPDPRIEPVSLASPTLPVDSLPLNNWGSSEVVILLIVSR